MAKQNIKTKSGFTIIEVVLVLAIAGLIFLMVFVALPALQRSQRDTARRDAMSRVGTQLTQYQSNNDSALPEGPSYWAACKDGSFGDNCEPETNAGSSNTPKVAKEFVQKYMNSSDATTNTFKDPDGAYYSIYITDNWYENLGDTPPALQRGAAEFDYDGNKLEIATEFDTHIVYVVPGGECDGEYAKKSVRNSFAVLYRLEGASVVCVDGK